VTTKVEWVEEAYAQWKAKQERDRQRRAEERGRRERFDVPLWCQHRPGDDDATRRRRERARLLFERATHRGTGDEEADTCMRMAEKMRAKYGL